MVRPMVRIVLLGLVVIACTAQPVVAPVTQPSASVASAVPPATSAPVASPAPAEPSPRSSKAPSRPGGSPTATSPPSTTPPESPSSVLRIGVTGDPGTLGLIETQQEDWKVELLFDRLYQLDPSLRPQPSLAVGLPEISSDGREWTVRLHDGVRFHDGSPLDSDDVVSTFELLAAETCTGTSFLCRAVRAHVESVEVVDPLTVRFTVRPPAVAFLADALAQAPILPSDALADALAAFDARLSTVRPAELRAAGRALTGTRGECDATLWWPVVVERFGCEPPVETVTVAERLDAAGLLPSEPLDLYETQTSVLGGLLHEYRRVAVAQGPERMARALHFLPLAREPIGSGPYRFEDRTDPDTVELVASDDHWGGLAVTPTVTIRWFGWPSNEDSLPAAIRDGELDWVPHGAARSDGPVEPLAWVDSAGLGVVYLALDAAPGSIFEDVRVRIALDRCVDRSDIVAEVTGGGGHIVRSPIHPGSWAFAERDAPAASPDEARRLLEAAGWRMVDGTFQRDGRRLEADLGARPSPDRWEFLTRLGDAARPCGFDLSVREADITVVVGQEAPLIWRLYDGYLTGWGSLSDPDHAYDAFHRSADPRQGITERSTPWNIMRWSDQIASDALDAGRATHDPAVRFEAYRTFQARLEAEMPVIWGWADGLDAVISPDIRLDGAPLDLSHPRYHAEIESWRLVGP